MTRWEYKRRMPPTTYTEWLRYMKILGDEGWELVCVWENEYVFKRAKEKVR